MNRSFVGIFNLSSEIWSLWSENSIVKITLPHLTSPPSFPNNALNVLENDLSYEFHSTIFQPNFFQTCRDNFTNFSPLPFLSRTSIFKFQSKNYHHFDTSYNSFSWISNFRCSVELFFEKSQTKAKVWVKKTQMVSRSG